ncbi:MAG: hypothetical protein JL50_11695 [Peptococcaceae bacterium BICA1-7]|nr:MAG: hypothetical protein JL50_11695 [Peptococcaceae bacterium BICA1-7]HBV98784.1 [cytidine(C)-cytidine(C)-adenosine (A)]-adding enzyme [Desulfotomaculum sp.]
MNSDIRIDMNTVPLQVREVMERLGRRGFSVYLVGGVVRDFLQGREPRDYDVATGATPDQVCGLFEKVVLTGEKHGTVTVISGDLSIEVTTLRRDGCYSDSRRPDTVLFTGNLKEDLSRRDFTINSLAADLDGNVYDFFGGLKDISGRIIRAVGDPEKRFKEDALRMMRALRIACQTGFSIEERTLESIRASRRRIARVSPERIREELNDILVSSLPHRGVELMKYCGLMGFIVPELDSLQDLRYTLEMLKNTPAGLNVRLAALLYVMGADCPPPEDRGECRYRRTDNNYNPVEEILDRLKYDRRTVQSVTAIVRERIAWVDIGLEKSIKKFMARVRPENLEDIFSLWRASAAAAGEKGSTAAVVALEERARGILENNLPLRVRDLAINGNDLKAMGIRPGKEMGRILRSLLDIVLDDPQKNQKVFLIDLVKGWKSL